MAMIKGVTLTQAVKYNKELMGEDGYNKILSLLEEENRKVMSGSVLDTNWYPIETLINFTEVVFNTLLNKNINALKKGSKLIAENQLKTTHKALLLLGTPEAIIEKIDTITLRYFQDVDIKTELIDKKKLRVTYSGFEKKHQLYEITTEAWWEVIFENLNAKNVKTQITTSLNENKGYFEFIVTWE